MATSTAGDAVTSPGVAPILITVSAALVAGALELGVLGARRLALGHMVFTGWQTLWTTPVSYVLLMLPLGVGLAVVGRWLPRRIGPPATIFAPAFVGAFSVCFLFYPAVHKLAVLLLALGVAAQATRVCAPRLRGVARAAGRANIWGGALVLLAAAIVHGGGMFTERRALAGLPVAAHGAPNVLLIVLDAVRTENLSLYGYPHPTAPELTRLASHGITFLQAYATAPWTLTSHATLFTGRYPDELAANWSTPLEHGPATLAGVLARRGYATAGFVANVAYCARETGLARGFARYEDYLVTPAELVEASSLGRIVANNPRLRAWVHYYDIPGRKTAGAVTAAFLGWQARVGSRPFFAFLNLYDAHEPYLPPPPFDTAFGPRGPRDLSLIRPLNGRMFERLYKDRMSPVERRAEANAYDGAIASADRALGGLFDELARRGQLARTLVIVAGDHGEQFGEHGLFSHANSLYLPLLHVPLVMALPGRLPAGLFAETPVTLRDLPATVLALVDPGAGAPLPGHAFVAPDGMPVATGSALFAQVRPPPNQNPRYPTAHGEMRSLIADGWHYIRGPGTVEELYAFPTDSAEVRNLATRPETARVMASFRRTLDSLGGRPR